jgi:hypothetical protein
MLCSFFSTNIYDGYPKARWPLVFISAIFNFLSGMFRCNDIHGILSDIAALCDEYKSYTSKVGYGKGWQTIVNTVILMRSLRAYLDSNDLDIFGMIIGKVTIVELNRLPRIKSFEDAKTQIETIMECKSKESIVLFYPPFNTFPICESLLVYKTISGEVLSYALQVKLGKDEASGVLLDCIMCGFLVGGICKREYVKIGSKWVYLSRDQIEECLGHLLDTGRKDLNHSQLHN